MSANLKNLTEAYRQILASINVVTQSDDLLVQDIDDMKTQIMVDGKPLALPTDNIVNNYSDSFVVFHPICENLLLGESPVLQEFRLLIMEALNEYTSQLVDSILSIAVDEQLVSELKPTQVEFMRCAAGADANSLTNWRAVMRRAGTRGTPNRLLTIFLKRGAMFNGGKHKRVANVNFNILDKIEEGGSTLFGAKVRKNDLKIYNRILQKIFSKVEDEDGYNAASDSLTAPYFESLILAYHNVLKDLNSVSWNLRKPIEQSTARKLHVNDDFMELLSDVRVYRDVLPTMPLNDGDRNTRREEEDNKNAIPANSPQDVSNLANQTNPFYDQPPAAVQVQPQANTAPVQQPQFNAPPQQQPQPNQQQPTLNNTNQFANNGFPSLQEQLAGAPLGGYTAPVHGAIPPHMNPYQQNQGNQQMYNNMPFNGGNQQQMAPGFQQPMYQNWQQQMPQGFQQQQMPPGFQQNPFGQQQMYNQQPNGFQQQPNPFGFPQNGFNR